MVLLFPSPEILTPSPPFVPFPSIPFPSLPLFVVVIRVKFPFSRNSLRKSLQTRVTTNSTTRHNELDHASQRRNAYKM